MTYAPGENVEYALRHTINSAPSKTIEKFRHYTAPDVGEIRLHYGHANDPKTYEKMSHGLRSDDKSFVNLFSVKKKILSNFFFKFNSNQKTTKDCINPAIQSRFNFLKNEFKERPYLSQKSAPLGRVPKGNLPETIDPISFKFGISTEKSESAKECINPDKPRFLVELESSDKHEMYVYSHKDYEPGEQKDRLFSDTFDRYKRFGLTTEFYHDGRKTKESLNWLPTKLLDKRTQSESKLLDDFREKHTNQIGQKIDPNRETRNLGPDHVFGLTNTSDPFSSGDIIHNRSEENIMKGKDRERAYVAVVRSHLARYNLVKFKTLVDAFKYYDKVSVKLVKACI